MSAVHFAWKAFNDYIHEGEPRIRKWTLLGNISTPLIISISYALFVKVIGPALMKNRKPYNFRSIMAPYNFALVLFYIYFLLRGFLFLPQLGTKVFCGSLSIKSMGPAVENLFTLGWQLYIVKYVELLDTVFLVLSKKFNMITPLHVIHHAIVPIFGFIGFRSETSAYLSVFMMVNSFIHVIMYSYYGIAALGPKYQKYLWWKKYLTVLQIAQFAVMSIYIMVMSYLGCTTSKVTYYICLVIAILFLILFINYYKNMFLQRPHNLHNNKNGTSKLPNISVTDSSSNGESLPIQKKKK